MYEDRPTIFRGPGQSFEERKEMDQARVAREKLLREAGRYLSDDDLHQIIKEGEKRTYEPDFPDPSIREQR